MKKVPSMTEQDLIAPMPSNVVALDRSVSVEKAPHHAEATAGAVLRHARQAKGMDIDAMAATLKVPTARLQALEHDRFDLLLDAAFARALASSVCRMLKLDPAPVLLKLPPITAFNISSQNRGINASFRPRETALGSPLGLQLSRPALALGGALLLGTLVLIFLPSIQQELAKYRSNAPNLLPKEGSFGSVSGAVPLTSETVVASGAPVGSTSAITEPQPPPATQAFVTGVPEATPALQSTSGAETRVDEIVSFKAKNETWLRVTDAKGVLVLSRTLGAGESATASGALPLQVAIGRADAIDVQVRGRAFDLNAVAKNNIARFEVK